FANSTDKLQPSEVKEATKEIWEIWKSVVHKHASLPVPDKVTKQSPPIEHQWNLIKEDPMPFYYIKKTGEKSIKKYPLHLNLHGSGPKERELKATLYWSLNY